MLLRRCAPVFAVAALTVAGCGRSAAPPQDSRGAPEQALPVQAKDAFRAQAVPAGAPAPAAAPDEATATTAPRKLIWTGQLTIEVVRYESAAASIAKLAEAQGGYVAETRSSKSDQGKERGNLTIRVPAERFAGAMAALKRLGSVRAESAGTQDVTKAYVDLETRLRVKREALDRIRNLLRTQTGSLADVLAAEREITRITEEIEQQEGERRFYDQQVALSTIHVEAYEPEPLLHGGALAPIREAASGALQVLGESVAAVIYVTVFLVPWLLVLWALWRVVRASRSRRKAKAS